MWIAFDRLAIFEGARLALVGIATGSGDLIILGKIPTSAGKP